jgi:hypothetical protein
MADHFSGPRAVAEPCADITDLFAFPSPQRTGRLVLVLNVFPRATVSAFFSDAILASPNPSPIQPALPTLSDAALGPSASADT